MAEDKTATGRQRRRTAPKKSSQSTKKSLNMAELRELAELVIEHGFTDFEFENENIRVRLGRVPRAAAPPSAQPLAVAVPQTPVEALPETDVDAGLFKITSPIVGTFYRSPSPDKDPYIKEGDTVSESTVVCIVEAMKLMNEIQAEVSGSIVKIYVENGQPVEYGQPLFGVRK
jgi:acetyl-CoA carboxylase biotin carboxyl carrier protein